MKKNKNGTIGIYKIYHLKGNKKNENMLVHYLSIDKTKNKNNITKRISPPIRRLLKNILTTENANTEIP